ncbi:MAG: glycosyl transferase [Bacteroidetes bacterium]|nr:MAG: glycosyl transferase [Bacteroidota bacterium]
MQNLNRLLYFFALVKFVLPFILQSPFYEPHRDEFLYLAEGRHLAWGYMEVPPLLSVFAWLTNLLGGGMFWIKFWPSLFGAVTFIIVGKIILSLGGRSFALLLGLLPFLFGAYLRVHYLFQPNFLEIFFWTMIAYSLLRYIQTESKSWLYIFGTSVGLGMLSKYSVAFFVLSILIGLLLTEQRKIFRNKHFYYAALLAFIIFLPNLVWQYLHHFPVVYHMKELEKNQLQYISPVSFLVGQLLMNLVCAYIWIRGLLFTLFSNSAKQFRFVGWAYILVIALLLLGRGKVYYSLGAYPVLFAFGAYALEKGLTGRLKILRYVLIAFSSVSGFFLIPLLLPVFEPEKLAKFYKDRHIERTGALRWEDLKDHPLQQDFSDMLGWKEMAKKMADAYNTLDSNEKKQAILFCDNYGQAGAVNYYGRQYNLPLAYSDNASFFYWMPDSLKFDNLVLLTDDQNEMSYPFIKDFSAAVLKDSITTPFARERGSLIIVMKNGNENFKKMFAEKIEKDKAKVKW